MSESQSEVRVEVAQQPDRADVERIDQGIESYILEHGGLDAVRPMYLFAREAGRAALGGIIARSWGTCCEVQILWVEPDRRRTGLGRELMARAEREAKARGCELVYLDTFTFQAPDFYRRLGYSEDLAIAGFPGGVVKYHFSKRLT